MSKIATERLSISTKGRYFNYDLYRSDRQTLEISVQPNGTVSVTAPHDTNLKQIEEKIGKRILWIERNIREINQLPQPLAARQWVSGETHRYLGRQYRLKVEMGEPISISLKGAFFNILVPNKTDVSLIREEMELWYRNHARPIFEQRLSQCLQVSKPFLGIERADLVVRKMKTRWGSCTNDCRFFTPLEISTSKRSP